MPSLKFGAFSLAMAALYSAIVLSINEGSSKTVEKYAWTSTESASMDFPVQLIRADLLLADKSNYYVPDDRVVRNGWGKQGATHFVGEDLKALPTKISTEWYSFAEDAFFGGVFELPIGPLQAYFNEGHESPRRNQRKDFDRIIFGFGPEGEGAVWVSGSGTVIQVMRFTAPKINLEWEKVLDDPEISRETYVGMVLAETLGARKTEVLNSVPLNGYWSRRQQKFAYSLRVIGAVELNLLRLESLTGERIYFDEVGPLITSQKLGVPQKITIEWIGAGGEKRVGEIIFREHETLAVFEKLAQDDSEISLFIEIAASSNAAVVILRNSNMEYEFPSENVSIFSN